MTLPHVIPIDFLGGVQDCVLKMKAGTIGINQNKRNMVSMCKMA